MKAADGGDEFFIVMVYVFPGEVQAHAAGRMDGMAPGARDQLPLYSVITARLVHQLCPGMYVQIFHSALCMPTLHL